jgi:hypothetical protein
MTYDMPLTEISSLCFRTGADEIRASEHEGSL